LHGILEGERLEKEEPEIEASAAEVTTASNPSSHRDAMNQILKRLAQRSQDSLRKYQPDSPR
jgi:hypothetical protein